MAKAVYSDRAPDHIQGSHDHQHIEEIEIAHGRDKNHHQGKPRFLFPQIPLTSDQQKREKDKGIQEVMMPHSRHGKAVENIYERTDEHSDPVLSAHIKVVCAERDPRQPEADQQHQVMEKKELFLRHENRRQAEGIAKHIICQCRIQISAVPHPQ